MKIPRIPGIAGFERWFSNSRKVATVADARKILGPENVIPEDVVLGECYRSKKSAVSLKATLSYPRQLLETSRALIDAGNICKLVYRPGLSSWALREKFPAEFCASSVWERHPSWLDKELLGGYRLINFSLDLVGAPDVNRGSSIDEPALKARTKISTMAECLIIIKMIQGLRLLSDSYHCGEVVEDGMVPLIGSYGEQGMLLYMLPEEVFQLGVPSVGVSTCFIPEEKA